MPNPFNSEVAQANKSGGGGFQSRSGAVPSPSLNMKTASWPEPAGKTNPGWKPKHGRKAAVYPKSQGL